MGMVPRWTQEQLDAINTNPGLCDRELTRLVNSLGPERTLIAVKSRRKYAEITRANPWTDAALVAGLARLHASGLSASQIGKALHDEFGVRLSRNAVIGKIHRLGIAKPDRLSEMRLAQHIERRAKKPPAPTKAARQFQHGGGCEVTEPKPAKVEALVGPTPASLNVPMWDHRFAVGCCKYGTKEEAGVHLFCCAPVQPGAPYCGPHLAATRQVGTLHARAVAEAALKARAREVADPRAEVERAIPVDEAVDPDTRKRRAVRFGYFGEAA